MISKLANVPCFVLFALGSIIIPLQARGQSTHSSVDYFGVINVGVDSLGQPIGNSKTGHDSSQIVGNDALSRSDDIPLSGGWSVEAHSLLGKLGVKVTSQGSGYIYDPPDHDPPQLPYDLPHWITPGTNQIQGTAVWGEKFRVSQLPSGEYPQAFKLDFQTDGTLVVDGESAVATYEFRAASVPKESINSVFPLAASYATLRVDPKVPAAALARTVSADAGHLDYSTGGVTEPDSLETNNKIIHDGVSLRGGLVASTLNHLSMLVYTVSGSADVSWQLRVTAGAGNGHVFGDFEHTSKIVGVSVYDPATDSFVPPESLGITYSFDSGLTIVPEPICIGLFSIAAVMLGGCRFRTRRGKTQ